MESPYFQCENLKLESTLTRHHEKIFPRTRAIFTYSVAKHAITRVVTISGSGTRDIQGWQNLPRAIQTKSGSQNCVDDIKGHPWNSPEAWRVHGAFNLKIKDAMVW